MVNCCGNYDTPRCFRVKRRATLHATPFILTLLSGKAYLILCPDTSTDRYGRELLWLFYYAWDSSPCDQYLRHNDRRFYLDRISLVPAKCNL